MLTLPFKATPLDLRECVGLAAGVSTHVDGFKLWHRDSAPSKEVELEDSGHTMPL
jgi:hypothetical protein